MECGGSSGGGSIYGELRMSYELGQKLWWSPVYFKWDEPHEVEVVKTYRCGSALLSNHQTVSKDGVAEWDNGVLLGRVHAGGSGRTV